MKNGYFTLFDSPFGAVMVTQKQAQFQIELSHSIDAFVMDDALCNADLSSEMQIICTQIKAYLYKKIFTFNLSFDPIQNQQGTAFQKRVWQAISEIPIGETQTYSDIAKNIGSGPRAVANACGANVLPILIPCHRVVAKNGLGGYMQGNPQGLMIKKWLLSHEGIHYE